jgi:two-component system, LytTR family, response regulator
MQRIYKCLITDDSPIDRDVVEMYVSKIENLQIEAVCSDGLEAAAVLQQKEIDIVFSDIDMPDLSGLELKQSLQNPPVFIFISSYAEYAAESYNLDVIDFITKPVSFARLVKATNKAIEYIELKKKTTFEKIENVAEIKNETIFVKDNDGFTQIKLSEIIYIESMGNFSKICTKLKTHITLVSLKNIEEQLPNERFIRVHKQYIIHLPHIISITASAEITLINNHIIPLGNTYKLVLMEAIQQKTINR